MTNEEFIAQNLCNDCNDKETCSVSCYWFDHMKRLAELKDEQFAKDRQALIEKVCEILYKTGYFAWLSEDEGLSEEVFISQFKQSIEGTK